MRCCSGSVPSKIWTADVSNIWNLYGNGTSTESGNGLIVLNCQSLEAGVRMEARLLKTD